MLKRYPLTGVHRCFPYKEVKHSENAFTFIRSLQEKNLTLPDEYADKKYTVFDKFLKSNGTVAFLVIKNDTVNFERYFRGYHADSLIAVFSVAKSILSALAGIAIYEGFIDDINDSVTKYLPGHLPVKMKPITIEHLLNMRSGIKFKEDYNSPFGQMAKFYYGRNLKKYVSGLEVKEPPGFRYDYVSCNSQILGMIIEKTTGETLSGFLERRIWQPLGMEHDARWGIDSKKHGQVKAFGNLSMTALDLAKFGRLYLAKGNWNGKQIIPEEWVMQSTTIRNDSKDNQGYPYTYSWRVINDGQVFFAKGILGQYLYIDRERDLVMIRCGKRYGGIDWADFMKKLSEQI